MGERALYASGSRSGKHFGVDGRKWKHRHNNVEEKGCGDASWLLLRETLRRV
jgi:hypothetical protein